MKKKKNIPKIPIIYLSSNKYVRNIKVYLRWAIKKIIPANF